MSISDITNGNSKANDSVFRDVGNNSKYVNVTKKINTLNSENDSDAMKYMDDENAKTNVD